MSRSSSQTPEGLLSAKFLSFNNDWFIAREKEFRVFDSKEGKYDKISNQIIYTVFCPERASDEIPDDILLEAAKNKNSFLWDTFHKNFANYCWNSSIETDEIVGFCELLPLAINYFEAKTKELSNLYLFNLEDHVVKLFNKTKNHVVNEIYGDDDSPEHQVLFIETFNDENKRVFNDLLNKLNTAIEKQFAQKIQTLKLGLSETNEQVTTRIDLQKCQKICNTPIFGRIPLENYYDAQNNGKSAAEFFFNMISSNPKKMNGEFNLQGYGLKSILYNLLFTIEKVERIQINRDLIEAEEWICFTHYSKSIKSDQTVKFDAKSSKKHLALLPTVKEILSST